VAATEMAASTQVTAEPSPNVPAAMPATAGMPATAATRQRIGRNGAASQRYGRDHAGDLQQVELHHRRTFLAGRHCCCVSRRSVIDLRSLQACSCRREEYLCAIADSCGHLRQHLLQYAVARR
jgi:hypothetical protein